MTLTSPSSNRIASIDVLRGFALFGIAIVHIIEQYYAGQWPAEIEKAQTPHLGDYIAQGFAGIFIMGKFYMIFSFLFGLSFFIQFSKREGDTGFLVRFAWRLIILFAIGMLHHLHYRGDILTIYALLGIPLLLLHRLPDKWLLVVAVLLILNIPSFLTRGVQAILNVNNEMFNADQPPLMNYYNAVKNGTYLEILKANFDWFNFKMSFQVWSGRLYITFGLFLLGIYAGRKQLFENVSGKIRELRKTVRYSLFAILGVILFSAAFFGIMFLLKISIPDQINWMVGGLALDIFNTALAIIYVAGILLLFQKEKWNRRLMALYPVGRMGLTTYLMQTVFGTLLFFSYGLQLLGEIGPLVCLFIAIGFYIFQIAFAIFWFRYFSYGPVEWLWRTLTYFKVQPLPLSRPSVS